MYGGRCGDQTALLNGMMGSIRAGRGVSVQYDDCPYPICPYDICPYDSRLGKNMNDNQKVLVSAMLRSLRQVAGSNVCPYNSNTGVHPVVQIPEVGGDPRTWGPQWRTSAHTVMVDDPVVQTSTAIDPIVQRPTVVNQVVPPPVVVNPVVQKPAVINSIVPAPTVVNPVVDAQFRPALITVNPVVEAHAAVDPVVVTPVVVEPAEMTPEELIELVLLVNGSDTYNRKRKLFKLTLII